MITKYDLDFLGRIYNGLDGDKPEWGEEALSEWRCIFNELDYRTPIKLTDNNNCKRVDNTWGLETEVYCCPKCGCDLIEREFLGDWSGKRKITACDTCGQLIDWSDVK